MTELAVVTRPDIARGYRLAGVLTEPAADAAQAQRAVASLLGRGGVTLIAIDEDLLASLSDALRQRILNHGVQCVTLPPQFSATPEVEG